MESFVWFNSSVSILVEAVLYEDGYVEKSIFSIEDETVSTPKSKWSEVPRDVMEALLSELGMPLDDEEPSDAPEDQSFKFYVGLCLCQLFITNGAVSFSINGTFEINENIPEEWRRLIVLKAVRTFRKYTKTQNIGTRLYCEAYNKDGNGGRRKDFYKSLGFTCVDELSEDYLMVYTVEN